MSSFSSSLNSFCFSSKSFLALEMILSVSRTFLSIFSWLRCVDRLIRNSSSFYTSMFFSAFSCSSMEFSL